MEEKLYGEMLKIRELLEEVLVWVKYDYLTLKNKIIEFIQTDQEKIVYEYSDGERSLRDLCKLADVHHTTVKSWLEKWYEEGIVDSIEKYGGKRYIRIVSLAKFGISIPEILEKE